MRKNSIKNTRINSEVTHELAMIFRELKDPRIDVMTSVTDAVVTPDLKYCTVYVSIMGDDETAAETLKALDTAKGFIRKELASRVNLRITPELKFVRDNSLEYGMKMDKLIEEVVKKDESADRED